MRILVVGASGYIGSQLVPELLERSATIRALSRHRTTLEARNWQGVEIVEADVLDRASIHRAVQGVDIAYYLVHSMAAGKDFGQLDRVGARNFADAAGAAGVQRIIYLGGLIPDDDSDSEHIVSRQETGEILRTGRTPVVELRAGIITGPGSAAFEVMRDLVLHLPIMITPRWVRAKSPPIALANLLHYLVELGTAGGVDGRIFDAAGPETLTYETMMRIVAQEAGRREPVVIPVPLLSVKLSSYWLRLITSVPTNVAQALIQGLKHDFYADDAELRALIPQQLEGFRESVTKIFEAERSGKITSRWTEGAFPLRNDHIEYGFYAKKASGSARTFASPESVWAVLGTIGGDNRYFYLNFLWTIREFMDWIIGGPGRKHQRRDPVHLQLGDPVDSWYVIGCEPSRQLNLAFGMKAPGAGMLEFRIDEDPAESNAQSTTLTATACWHPAGVWGLLYWWSLFPAHLILFDGLTSAIVKRAEQLEAKS